MANVSLRWLSIVLYKTSLGQPSEMEETKSFRMLLRDYHSLVKLYSCENPTHSSGKLPAFSGIVMRLSPRTGSYFARIWNIDLLVGLLWKHESGRCTTQNLPRTNVVVGSH